MADLVPAPEGDCSHCDGITVHVGRCPVDPSPPWPDGPRLADDGPVSWAAMTTDDYEDAPLNEQDGTP